MSTVTCMNSALCIVADIIIVLLLLLVVMFLILSLNHSALYVEGMGTWSKDMISPMGRGGNEIMRLCC